MICLRCKKEKDVTEMTKSHPKQCKSCRKELQVVYRAGLKERERKQALLEAAARNEAELIAKHVALPRTYVTHEVWVPSERTYYRNNGNRHIPSRGV